MLELPNTEQGSWQLFTSWAWDQLSREVRAFSGLSWACACSSRWLGMCWNFLRLLCTSLYSMFFSFSFKLACCFSLCLRKPWGHTVICKCFWQIPLGRRPSFPQGEFWVRSVKTAVQVESSWDQGTGQIMKDLWDCGFGDTPALFSSFCGSCLASDSHRDCDSWFSCFTWSLRLADRNRASKCQKVHCSYLNLAIFLEYMLSGLLNTFVQFLEFQNFWFWQFFARFLLQKANPTYNF
jgi:hypothetical protein